MKKIIFHYIILMFFFAGFINAQNHKPVSEPVKDGLLIHITEGYSNPHRVLMPLKMATLMAADKDVLVYLDIHAVELVLKSSKDLSMDGFESLMKMLKTLINDKVGIYVCPTCLKVAGYSESDLIPGVKLAQKEMFFNFTKGRIVTLDY